MGRFQNLDKSQFPVRSGKKRPNQETRLGHRGGMKVLNNVKLDLNE